MKILVAEDTVMMAKSLIDILESAGHQVDWTIGFNDAQKPTGITPEGADFQVDVTRYELVLMDGDFERDITGPMAVPAFAKAGIACFGTSTLPEFNDEMIKAGAVYAVSKPTILFALFHKRVTPEALVASSEETRAALASAADELKDNAELRKEVDKFLIERMSQQ